MELLVSIVLLSLLILGFAPLMLMSVSTTAAAEESSRLTVLASDRLEALTSLPFEHADLSAGGSLAASEAGYSVDPVDGAPNLWVRWEIVDASPLLKRVRVAAGSTLALVGPAREVVIETYRVDNDS